MPPSGKPKKSLAEMRESLERDRLWMTRFKQALERWRSPAL